MTRHVFFSFNYNEDNWRAAQVRGIRDIDGNKPAHDNDWEAVERGGDQAIRNWIKEQMRGRSCVAVLIGSDTAGRKWVNYEICEGWKEGKAVFGIYINGLQNRYGQTSRKGENPFNSLTFNGKPFSLVVPVYDPTVLNDSRATYANIAGHMETWIEKAIHIRGQYP